MLNTPEITFYQSKEPSDNQSGQRVDIKKIERNPGKNSAYHKDIFQTFEIKPYTL